VIRKNLLIVAPSGSSGIAPAGGGSLADQLAKRKLKSVGPPPEKPLALDDAKPAAAKSAGPPMGGMSLAEQIAARKLKSAAAQQSDIADKPAGPPKPPPAAGPPPPPPAASGSAPRKFYLIWYGMNLSSTASSIDACIRNASATSATCRIYTTTSTGCSTWTSSTTEQAKLKT
jgi:hypothetical protein